MAAATPEQFEAIAETIVKANAFLNDGRRIIRLLKKFDEKLRGDDDYNESPPDYEDTKDLMAPLWIALKNQTESHYSDLVSSIQSL